MTFPPWLRRALLFLAAPAVLIVLLFLAAIRIAPGLLHPYFTGQTFRQKISEETSRGLKVEGEYGPIAQQGWEALTPEFRSHGRPGESIAVLNASGIRGLFNPWGVFRRRWQLDWVTLDQATIELRRSDPAAKIPLPVKPKPWYHFLLPSRLYLKEVRAERAEVLWTFRGQLAGVHHIRLRITPYGAKDWRFRSDDGSGLLEMPPLPPLRVAAISVILTKPWFYLEHAVLAPPDDAAASLRLDGKAGLQDDKSLVIHAVAERMPLSPWLPEGERDRLQARVDAEADWIGPGPRTAGSQSTGHVRLADAVLGHLPLLDQLALFSNNPAFREIHFVTASCDWKWNDPSLDVAHLAIEAPGLVRLEGHLHGENGALSGELELGLRPPDLKWLPQDGRKVFTQRDDDGGGYAWAKVTLSGTLQKPIEDLTPRIRKAIFGSPGTLLKMGLKELFGPKE